MFKILHFDLFMSLRATAGSAAISHFIALSQGLLRRSDPRNDRVGVAGSRIEQNNYFPSRKISELTQRSF